MLSITLKNGAVKEFDAPLTAAEVAKSLGGSIGKDACVAKIDGEICDLRTVIDRDCALELFTFDSAEGKHAFWHSTSHILAQAFKRLFPKGTLAIGPAIDTGFYYDFDIDRPLTPEDVQKIEDEMRKVVKENLEISRFELSPAEATALMEQQGEPYKVELIAEHAGKGEPISFYKQGEFTDLCAGPHVLRTGVVKAIKLTHATGAYWRGDAKGKQLSRVYGVSFPKASMLEAHLTMLEEAKRRDHRKLGKELGLFTMMEEGPGFPFFLPKGMILKNTLIDYWREIHTRAGYQEINTPIMLNRELWEQSGHWDHYKDNMYTTSIDEEDFCVKPMNCPGGMLVYKTQPHSYRDLPLRMGELGLVHRHELSGALHGLMRVRCFTQDDAHIFMTPEQVKDEIKGVVRLIDEVYSLFGFEYHIELSTMPEDHIGEPEEWERATDGLREAIEELGRTYDINEGDGAFYGPKLDFHLVDAIGRTWQCGTIQLDMQMPERFDLEYTGADDKKHRPVMIHRVVFGSIERFIGILIEHFAGAFPAWLSPKQVTVMPISDRHLPFAEEVRKQLAESGIRVDIDARNEKIGYKIREAQLLKTPYMLVIGDKEMEAGAVAVRSRAKGDLGAQPVAEFVSALLAEIASKDR